jgi:cation transport ATPase
VSDLRKESKKERKKRKEKKRKEKKRKEKKRKEKKKKNCIKALLVIICMTGNRQKGFGEKMMCWQRGNACFLLLFPLVFNSTPKSTFKKHPSLGR